MCEHTRTTLHAWKTYTPRDEIFAHSYLKPPRSQMLLPSANSSGDSEIFIQKPPSFLYWISTYWEASMCWAQHRGKNQVDRSLTFHQSLDPVTEWAMGGSHLDSRLGCSVVMSVRGGRGTPGVGGDGVMASSGTWEVFSEELPLGVRMKGFVTKVLQTEFASVKSGQQISLVTQWLGLHPFMPMAQVQTLVRELRSHKPCGTAKKKKSKKIKL